MQGSTEALQSPVGQASGEGPRVTENHPRRALQAGRVQDACLHWKKQIP